MRDELRDEQGEKRAEEEKLYIIFLIIIIKVSLLQLSSYQAHRAGGGKQAPQPCLHDPAASLA
jgi:hypothetical protein